MKKMVLAAVAALSLVGCGAGGGKSALIESCAKEGTDRKKCTCIADEMEKNLDKKVFAAITTAAAGKNEDAQKAIEKLPPDQAMAAGMGMVSAAMKCGMAGPT